MKQLKQFQLQDKASCVIYLKRIIGTMDLCIVRLNEHLKEMESELKKYKDTGTTRIPHKVYADLLDKTSNLEVYLLNAIGDMQSTSISYIKYRQQANRLIKVGNKDIQLSPLSVEIEGHLQEFNRLRNWQNHIPESLLTAELSIIQREGALLPLDNPIEVYYYDYVLLDDFEDLYFTMKNFYDMSRLFHQSAKRDYSLLIGESVTITRISKEIKTANRFEAVKLSAKVQGLNVED